MTIGIAGSSFEMARPAIINLGDRMSGSGRLRYLAALQNLVGIEA